MTKPSYGEGGIDARGNDTWRLRYRVKRVRYTVTFRGSFSEAKKELRRLIRSGDTGEHVAPDKITVGMWVQQWIAAGAPGRRRKRLAAERSSATMNSCVAMFCRRGAPGRCNSCSRRRSTPSTRRSRARCRRAPRTMCMS